MDIKVTEAAKEKLYEMGISEDTFLRIGVKSKRMSTLIDRKT